MSGEERRSEGRERSQAERCDGLAIELLIFQPPYRRRLRPKLAVADKHAL
jgi:hypothetical protein